MKRLTGKTFAAMAAAVYLIAASPMMVRAGLRSPASPAHRATRLIAGDQQDPGGVRSPEVDAAEDDGAGSEAFANRPQPSSFPPRVADEDEDDPMAGERVAQEAACCAAQPALLLPDLQVWPPFDLSVQHLPWNGRRRLRLAITFWNSGRGPLELQGVFDSASGQTQVWQQIHAEDGSVQQYSAGEFVWHPEHGHWHFEDFAVYELWSVSAKGALERVVATSGKVTFCILETNVVDADRPDFSGRRAYAICGPNRQGLSVGWGDTYASDLVGQMVDVTDVSNGVYALKVTVDPHNRLTEASDSNNAAVAYIEIKNKRVYVFEDRLEVVERLMTCSVLC